MSRCGLQLRAVALPPPGCGLQLRAVALPLPRCGLQLRAVALPPPGCGLQLRAVALPLPHCGLQLRAVVLPPLRCGLQLQTVALPRCVYEYTSFSVFLVSCENAFLEWIGRYSEAASGPVVHKSAEEVHSSLRPSTRFAYAGLVTTVIRLDFWNDFDPHSIFFCKIAFEGVMNCMGLPERTIKTLKTQLEGEEEGVDIAVLITTVRDDPVIKENGATCLLEALLLSFVASGNYDSRYRVLLRHLATLVTISWDEFEELEDCLAASILDEQFVESEGVPGNPGYAKKARERTQKTKKLKRYLMIGAAGGVGGVLIGLTGGLAAPLVAAGAGVLVGSGAVAAIATTAGAAVLGTTFGVAGAGLAGYKMKKRVGAIEEFSVETLSEGTGLHTTLVVSGWIDQDASPEAAFRQPWRHLWNSKEQYTLHYESRYLAELGKALDYLMSFAVSVAIQQTLMETALAGLLTAVAWPVAILSCASVLDNPWNVCISRSAEVGEQLAELLLTRAHGKRPITLIGFSLGARVIYHCLLTMSKRAECVGIVEDVILLGAPVTASAKQWAQLSTVVGGRIINGYCETDWLLRFVYRTMSAQISIAGTTPIDTKNNKKIYNYNLSHIVKGHLDYSRRLTEVLAAVGMRTGPHSLESQLDLERLDKEETAEATEAKETMDHNRNSNGQEVSFATGNEEIAEDALAKEIAEVRVVDKCS